MRNEGTTGSPPAPSRAGHDPDTPAALVEFMAAGWIDRPLAAEVHPQLARLRERRAVLSRAYPGAYLVIPAGDERVRANDTFFRFRTSSDFAYLMGDGEPEALLVMEPDGAEHRTVLFVREHNRGTAEFFTDRRHGELWVGRHRGVDESAAYYGADACRPLQAAAPYLQELSDTRAARAVVRGVHASVDGRLEESAGDAELATRLSEMRLLKDDYELAELRTACAITKRGFEDAIRTMRVATSEREIEAAFWSRARVEGNDVGYLTIAAAGHHACTLHWNRNDGALRPDALLLLDAGVECDSLYTADVTRTLPISGRFSGEARAIYDLVWEAQRAGIAAVVPGNDFLEPNRRAMRVLAQGLIDLRILNVSLDEALDSERAFYRRYTLHNVSHMLGLDVHDCAQARSQEYRYGKLRRGMVLTVEPGLYFQPDDATVPERFRGIGVRIEDDLAVTGSGAENLSAILPSKSADVEDWIAEVQQTPRSA
ncbi:MAG TPA: aminopeptidase P family protein [Candidatus Tumulicola sp.]